MVVRTRLKTLSRPRSSRQVVDDESKEMDDDARDGKVEMNLESSRIEKLTDKKSVGIVGKANSHRERSRCRLLKD